MAKKKLTIIWDKDQKERLKELITAVKGKILKENIKQKLAEEL